MSLKNTACLAAMLISASLVVPAAVQAADDWDKNYVSVPEDDGIVSSSGTKETLRTETPEAGVYDYITIGHAVYEGEGASRVEASYNKGIIQDGVTAEGNLYGGRAYYYGPLQTGMTVEASGNTLVLQKGSNAMRIYGGDAYDTTRTTGSVYACNNTVILESGGSFATVQLYGAFANSLGFKIASTSVASGNTVIISEGVTLESMPKIFGGAASDSSVEASGNSIYIAGLANDAQIMSVWAGEALSEGGMCIANNNVCELVLGNSVLRARSSGAAEAWNFALYSGDTVANGNILRVTGGTFAGKLFSGVAYSYGSNSYLDNKCAADGNSAVLDQVTVNKQFACGYAGFSGEIGALSASQNTASITDCTMRNVYGGCVSGYSQFNDSGVYCEMSRADENEISISGSTADNVYAGYAFSAYNAAATGNKLVKIENTVINGALYGGYAEACSAEASGNTGTLEDVTFSAESNSFFAGGMAKASQFDVQDRQAVVSGNSFEILGTLLTAYGGKAESSNGGAAVASGNELVLNDAEVIQELYGGCAVSTADTKYYPDTVSGDATASGNRLVLNGGSYKDAVYGGYALSADSNAEASGNVIVLGNGTDGKAPDLETATLYGGYASAASEGGSASLSGNALVFDNVAGMKAANIRNFQALSYEYTELRAGDVILELTGSGDEKATSVAGAEVSVYAGSLCSSDGGEFMPWDKVVLLKNDNGIDADGITQSVTATMGASLEYDAVIAASDDGTELLLTSRGAKARTGTKAIAEGAAAGLALASAASNAAAEALGSFSPAGGTVSPFGHVEASSMRHETGSSVSVSAVSLVAGLGTGIETGAGSLSLGAFFEYGKGSYATHNSFDSRADIDGDGTSWYMGGGILARMDFRNTGPGHFYLEGSAHMGTLHNEYDSNSLADNYGSVARFDMDSPYYSLHGGLGYVWNFAEGHNLDVYGRYFWTRVQGSDETLTTGDKFEFDDMDSSRVRLGARYAYNGNELFRPYVGIAWEHEFAGSCDSRTFGHDVAAPSFEGSSGMGELGIAMKPTEALPLSFNLGVQGYVGRKQGIAGSCSMMYEF